MTLANKTLTILIALFPLALFAQEEKDSAGITFSGSIESNIHIPKYDEAIETEHYDDWAMTNTYANFDMESRYVDAGARFEFLKHPLPGYEEGFRGWGVPYYYIKGKMKCAELTLGTFYEQFGSGLTLRSYEERSLGIDNSILGARLVLNPLKGMIIKALTGKQRRYWGHSDALLTGVDAQQTFPLTRSLDDNHPSLTLGASYVNIHHPSQETLEGEKLKRNVNLFSLRSTLNIAPVTLYAEYAHKSNDPSATNGYQGGSGKAYIFSAKYEKDNFSLLLRTKRTENLLARSERTQTGLAARVNFMPSFSEFYADYDLSSSFPAPQPESEQAYQAKMTYNFPEGTMLGGKYGTSLTLNFSHARSLHKDEGGTYYQDISAIIDKKINEAFSLKFLYINQIYNATVLDDGDEKVHNNIFITDATYEFNERLSLNADLEYLTSTYYEGDWLYGKLSLTVSPHWTFSVSDEWNCGETKTHYWYGEVEFSAGSHELSVGYGRVSEAYICVDGLCRLDPSMKGLFVSYNYEF
ncbi:MAG: DUF6029 family protein [Prevotella sp.]|nr:DUF6029 family protein [Prevotella sp.]